MKKIVLIALTLFPVVSLAGQWCRITENGEFCNFQTAESCYQVQNRSGGYCTPNSRDAGIRGDGKWCVVTPDSKNCKHMFMSACMAEIRRKQSLGYGCVENTELALKDSVKKFSRGNQKQEAWRFKLD